MPYIKEKDLYYGYVYLITNNVNAKKYVGQTTYDTVFRWKQHIRCSNNKKELKKNGMIFSYAINKYGASNFTVETLEVVFAKTKHILKEKLNRCEKEYIIKYNTLAENGCGYNITKGGNDVSPTCFTQVVQYDQNGNFIKKYDSVIDACHYNGLSERSFANIMAACRGNKRSAYGYIWRFVGDEFDKYRTKKLTTSKPFYFDMYTTSGDLLLSNVCIYDFLAKNSGYKYQKIKNVCLGTLKTSHNYVFRFTNDKFDKYDHNHIYHNKTYNCYSIDGKYIKTFNSLSECGKFIDEINYKNKTKTISKIMDNEKRSAYGYLWFHADNRNQPDKTKII